MSAIILLLSLVGAAFADNLGLLAGTLKTYQQATCNEEWMTLRCPIGTNILVTVARYGRATVDSSGKCSTTDPMIAENLLNTTCDWPNQTVVEVCQKKRQCTFNTSPKMGDPCPDKPKYTEVLYKCRPYEFRSKVACENDVINLYCIPNYRVAIFSASFGRTKYESLQCPQPSGVQEQTCLASYATEKVIDLCHGRRRCLIAANNSTFGDPCGPGSRTYLKVIYTCVWRTVLREQYGKGFVEQDEKDLPAETDEGFDRADFRVEFSPSPNLEGPQFEPRDNNATRVGVKSPSETSSPPRARTNNDVGERLHSLNAVGNERKAVRRRLPTANSSSGSLMLGEVVVGGGGEPTAAANCTTVIYATAAKEERPLVDFVNEWISAYTFLAQNQEKFYLYVIVSVTAGVLLLLGLVIGRLLLSRHRAKRDAKFHANNETLPNGFTDDISEIDADIDLTTPVPVPMQDTRIPETQLAERLHGERYYGDVRIPFSPSSSGHSMMMVSGPPSTTGMRVDLGNHMVGTDSLHTILRPESSRAAGLTGGKGSYYYG